jgi:hypothetical protein
VDLSDLKENFEELDDREIAKITEEPEPRVREKRKEKGFLRLDDFSNQNNIDDDLDVGFELDEMRKRQLQGYLGEKVCSLMENRVKNLLSDHVKSHWILRRKAEIISEDSIGHSIGPHPKRTGEIKIEGSVVKHFEADEKEIREKIEERCFKTSEELFKAFHKVRNPWIDFSFYAFQIEDTEQQTFNVKDFSESALSTGNIMEVEIPVISDFKIAALEVKTTNGEEERLLSKNQRKVREMAEESPFIDFFTLKIDTSFEELDIPEEFSGKFRKHS